MSSELVFVQMVFKGLHLERPPKVRLSFDVWLANDYAMPRWFLLPDEVGSAMRGADLLEVYRLSEDPRLVVGHWRGGDGFFALRLPAAARVTLRGLPISLWGDVSRTVAVEVECADRLVVAGAPAEAWFDADPLCDVRVDVDASSLADQRAVVAAREMPAPQPASVVVVASMRTLLTFELGVAHSGTNASPLPAR